jgi:uncharacterized protein involved in exopolysaccharide biosynthesis
MDEARWQDGDEISLLGIGTTLLRSRWRILRWMIAGGVLAGALVAAKPAIYTATTSFIPQGVEGSRSGLAGLAGQLGVSVSTGDPSVSPDFYSKVLKSRVLLSSVVFDTIAVEELGGQGRTFIDLFKISAGTPERRKELAVDALRKMVDVAIAKPMGVIEVSVSTPWRSASLALASRLIDGVNRYNQRTRQGQATSERKFVESRLSVALAELRSSEDRLEQFLLANRQLGSSPELTFQHERLQRDWQLRQQTVVSLTQANEEVRAREVRDTPVITIFEAPFVPTLPDPRGRVKSVAVGLMLGAFIGALLSLVSGTVTRRLAMGDATADEFTRTLGEVLAPIRRPAKQVRP